MNCEERMMHENSHADGDFPNDDCGDPHCPIKQKTHPQTGTYAPKDIKEIFYKAIEDMNNGRNNNQDKQART